MEAVMQGVFDGIKVDIQKRIDSAPDEARRLAHVKDLEVVKHHFRMSQLQKPQRYFAIDVQKKRRFIAFATGGCMMQADGTV